MAMPSAQSNNTTANNNNSNNTTTTTTRENSTQQNSMQQNNVQPEGTRQEDTDMSHEEVPTRPIYQVSTQKRMFCVPCLSKGWADCDFAARQEARAKGTAQATGLLMDCQNCTFWCKPDTHCFPAERSMNDELWNQSGRKSDKTIPEPRSRTLPKKRRQIPEGWRGTENPVVPKFAENFKVQSDLEEPAEESRQIKQPVSQRSKLRGPASLPPRPPPSMHANSYSPQMPQVPYGMIYTEFENGLPARSYQNVVPAPVTFPPPVPASGQNYQRWTRPNRNRRNESAQGSADPPVAKKKFTPIGQPFAQGYAAPYMAPAAAEQLDVPGKVDFSATPNVSENPDVPVNLVLDVSSATQSAEPNGKHANASKRSRGDMEALDADIMETEAQMDRDTAEYDQHVREMQTVEVIEREMEAKPSTFPAPAPAKAQSSVRESAIDPLEEQGDTVAVASSGPVRNNFRDDSPDADDYFFDEMARQYHQALDEPLPEKPRKR